MYTSENDGRHEKAVLSVGLLSSKIMIAGKRNEKGSCKVSWVNVKAISVTSWEIKMKTNIY